jgi:hypothetical protein
MEMRGQVIIEEHPDHDTEEARDFGHGATLLRSPIVRPSQCAA